MGITLHWNSCIPNSPSFRSVIKVAGIKNLPRPRLFGLSLLGHNLCVWKIYRMHNDLYNEIPPFLCTGLYSILCTNKALKKGKLWRQTWEKVKSEREKKICLLNVAQHVRTLFLLSGFCLGKYFSFGQCNHLFPVLISLRTNLCFLGGPARRLGASFTNKLATLTD